MKSKTYHDYIFISLIITIIIIFILIVLFLLGFFNIPACFFLTKLGIYCPACGATRAFIYLLKGDILRSILSNPIVAYSALSIIIYILLYIKTKISKKSEQFLSKYIKICSYIWLFIFIFNCIIRNIMLYVYDITI